MRYTVVARQGSHRYLLLEGTDESRAHVLDARLGRLYPTTDKDSILMRGPWITATAQDTADALAAVAAVESAARA